MNAETVSILINPKVSPDQLFAFYQRNDICEAGYGRDAAAVPLVHSEFVVAAFEGERLVGITRALFDGHFAQVAEFCLELEYQGPGARYENGSLVEGDAQGIGRRMGEALLDELFKAGADFIQCSILQEVEAAFYRSLGFELNAGMAAYIIDRRPYVRQAAGCVLVEATPEHQVWIRENWGKVQADHLCFEDGFTLVAVEGDRPVGAIAIRWQPLPGPFEDVIEGFVNVLEVDAGHRRRGVGRQLVHGASERCREKRAFQLRGWTSDDRPEALRFERALGFSLNPAVVHPKGQEVHGFFVTRVL